MKTAYAYPYGIINIEYEKDTLMKLQCEESFQEITSEELQGRSEFSDQVMAQVTEYLEGKRTTFELKYELHGTEFQQKVWHALQHIPYGETRTYKQIAEAIGNPGASRAVGMANNRNPLHMIIPCHRVIGADGSLTGYAGGLAMKEHLLKIESDGSGTGTIPSISSIKCAQEQDYARVRDFYYDLIDAMQSQEYKPGWEKDVYPTREFLRTSIQNSELYYIEDTDTSRLQAAMIVNHQYNDGYRSVKWSIDVPDAELLVVHALGVHPNYSGRGIAKRLVQFTIEHARQTGIKTIRMDVLEGNLPAEKAYVKMGFQFADTLQMYYDDTGWTNFRLFEYIV